MTPKYDLRPGLTLGRNYYIVDFLGSGYEGEVYKVEERKTGIMRAAKIFYEGRQLDSRKLKSYAQKLYRLRHCPIVAQYHHRDIARVGRNQVEILISDLVDGDMLDSFVKSQPGRRLTSFEALHLLYALCSGLERVHFLGEYHGDIHSDNIIVRRRGISFDVQILDFFMRQGSKSAWIFEDVRDLVKLLFEMIGGEAGYKKAGPEIKEVIRGRRNDLLRKRFRTAGQMRLYLENLEW